MSLLKKLKKRMEERTPDTKKLQRESAARAQKQVKQKQTQSATSKQTKETQKKATTDTKAGRAYTGFVQSTVGMPLELTGKVKVDDKVKESTSYKVGKVAGDFLSYGGAYAGVGKAIAKKTAKTAAKRVAREAAEEAVEKKIEKEVAKKASAGVSEKILKKETKKIAQKAYGKELAENTSEKVASKLSETKLLRKSAEKALKKEGKEVSEKALKREALKKADKVIEKAKQNVVADLTAGTALDTIKAKSEGIEIGSDEYKKYMLENALINVGAGVGFEALGAGIRGIKRFKNGKAVVQTMENGRPKYKVVDTNRFEGKVGSLKSTDRNLNAVQRKLKSVAEETPVAKEAPIAKETVSNPMDSIRKTVSERSAKYSQKNLNELENIAKDVLPEEELTRIYNTAQNAKGGASARQKRFDALSYELKKALDVDNGIKVSGDLEAVGRDLEKSEIPVSKEEIPNEIPVSEPKAENTNPFTESGAEKDIQSDSIVRERKNPLKTAMNDKGFEEYRRENNIKVREYAKENGISNEEAATRLYDEYRNPNIHTERGVEAKLFGDDNGNIVKDIEPSDRDLINVRTEPEKNGLRTKLKKMYDRFMYNWVDTSHAIEKFAKKVDDEMLSPLLDRVRNSITASQNMIAGEKQVLLLKDGAVDNGKSLKEIFKPIMELGDNYYHDFENFLYNRMNATYRYDAGKNVFEGIHTKEESKKIYEKLLKEHPEFETFADEVYNYLDGLRRMDVDSGMMSEETAKLLKEQNPFYVPSYRMEYFERMSSDKGSRLGSKDIRTAKGSDKGLIPLHEQMAFETQRRMQESALNDFGYKLMQDLGDDHVISVRSINGKELDVDSEMLKDMEIFDPKEEITPRAITDNGKGYVFNVRNGDDIIELQLDKDIFDAVKAINQASRIKLNGLVQANSLFRELVTTDNPLFAIRNGVRDFLDAPSFSQYGSKHFYKNYGAAWKHIVSNSDAYKTYKSLGGAGEGFFDIQKQFDDGSWFRRNIKDRIQALNEAVEQAPRFAEYLTTLEHEGNNKDAIVKALNNAHNITVNFGRHGEIAQIVNTNGGTFFNAGIQDLYRLGKVLSNSKSNPGALIRLIGNAALLGVGASALNELICGDMEGYKDLRTTEKDLNFLIPTSWLGIEDADEKFIKLPKGRVTSVFAMPFQRGMREAMGNTRGGEKWHTGMLKDVAEQIAPINPIENNLLAPAWQASQKDGKTWYGSPIVPQSLQNKKPADQYDESTTRLAVALGRQLNISPKRIDYVLKQYSGVFGQVGQGMPAIGRPSMSDSDVSLGSLGRAGQNVLKSNFIDDSTTNNGYSSNIYDRASELEMYKDDSIESKMAYEYMNEAKSAMNEYSKQIKDIQGNDSLSTDEKNKRTREIRREQIKVARQYLGNDSRLKDVAKDVSKKVNIGDFSSEKTYNSALKEQLKVRLNGADSVLAEEDAKAKEDGKKLISKRIKKLGLSPNEYYDLKARGATLKQFTKAKELGIDVDTFVGAQKATRDSKSYADKASRLIDGGYVKSFEEAEAYDIKKNTWNAVVWAKNNGMSSKKIAKVIGVDDAKQETRKSQKKYGSTTSSSGATYLTQNGLYNWIESEHGDLSNKEKSLLWRYYGYSNWQNSNPY